MKYTFTAENGQEKTVDIPNDWISKQRETLGIGTKEAVYMYLCDEGYINDPTVEELNAKAKGVRRKGAAGGGKRVKRKEDPTKRAIVEGVYHFLMSGELDSKFMFDKTIAPCEITNPERVISFSVGNDNYELTLSKKRK